jgi:hypothetical protein
MYYYASRINLSFDGQEAKVLRQILKERLTACAKEELALKKQAAAQGRANHMQTIAHYAKRTIEARALYYMVNSEIQAVEEAILDMAKMAKMAEPDFIGEEMPIDEYLNRNPEE